MIWTVIRVSIERNQPTHDESLMKNALDEHFVHISPWLTEWAGKARVARL